MPHLLFGGGVTIASMLPIVLIAYMFGLRWGFLSSFVYSLIQVGFSLSKGGYLRSLFLPNSSDFMGYAVAIWILILDYIVAYTILASGGVFRKIIKNRTLSLVLGVVLALSRRYLVHNISGYIFFGEYAEWFFAEGDIPRVFGNFVLSIFHGKALAIVYVIVYNGLYMVPEIIITSIAAVAVSRIPAVRRLSLDKKI